MRSKNSTKNAIISIIYYFITTFFTFISKTIFITYLGIEYNGLNSLTTNLLGILNVAELGLGTAIGYSLYKPLAENDHKKINEILSLYKYLYRIVALIVCIFGAIIALLLPSFVNTEIDMFTVEMCFILYLIATAVSYLFTYLNVLPSADQKNYKVVKIQGNGKIIKNIIQILMIIIFKNYYIWLVIEIIFNVVIYIYINYKIKKEYQWYTGKTKLTFKQLLKKYKEIVLKTRDLIFHKIGALFVYQTDNIVISYFCNLAIVGMYSNYLLIYTLLTGLIDQAFMGVTSSIGNLIIEGDNKRVYNVWKDLYSFFMFIAVLFSFLFFILSKPFISIWVGPEYLLSNLVVLGIGLNIFFKILKGVTERFKEAYGIFWDKYAPLVEAIINIVVSVALAIKMGVLGVVIGTVVSNIIIVFIWKPYVVFKYGFKEKILNYIIINTKYIILGIISCSIVYCITKFINIEVTNLMTLIEYFVIISTISFIIILSVFAISKDFRTATKKYLRLFKGMLQLK